ncbi:response regulator transcription factor [Stigmatella sp. ncwal1]|uniref:Response regulator transcription factor n=1 Tax=Stigmatella ashevillensis TaxID=2995309 RepID=A0ABT5DB16_9BACT|nr:response regulator transcription factor [Stigmatella ashevillena]MDC0710847.1 response regulator transcription factor [Stigmatella ashevillena]
MKTEPIRIQVVDDHPLIRDGLSALIRQCEDMRLVAEAADGKRAVELFREHRPDVTLMDLGLPVMDGMGALRAIRREFPDARILVLTLRQGDEDVHQALQAGARGYLLKGATGPEILGAIRAVHRGLRHVAPEAASALVERVGDSPLTEREHQTLEAMARGRSNKQIAQELSITEATVKAHVTQILSKLGVDDRTQAVTRALRRGLIHLD